jgi:phage portal protein BeeE
MNLITQFFRRTEAKALTISRDGAWDGFTPIGMSHRQAHGTDTASLQATMSESEIVYACLKVLSDGMGDPRLMVQRLKGKRDGSGVREYTEQEAHPLRRLIARPNPYMSESDLMRAAVVSWHTTNPRLFFVEKEFRRGLLVGLWPLDPACMSKRFRESDGAHIGWRWQRGSRIVDYALDDLIVREGPAWFNPAPSAAGAGSVRSDQAQTDYIGDFFENGGMPSVYLKDEERYLNPEQREQARARWDATYSRRARGNNSIVVLDKAQSVGKIGAALVDLDSETLRMVAESRICMVYGVPPLIIYAYVGLMRATYSNLKEAWASFWDFTLSPALKEWREFWTRTLLPEFEEQAAIDSGKVKLAYDMSTVAAMQDDVDALEARATNSYTKGIRKLNEARAILNLPPDPDGDRYYTAPAAEPQEDEEGDNDQPIE